MQKLLITLLAVFGIIVHTAAYDKEKAQFFNEFFKPFAGKDVSKQMQKITVEALMKRLELGEEFYFLDMRTEGETKIVRLGFENTLIIPMEKVFDETNLKKLPADKNIVVVCAKGSRATATAMALRQIGFTKTFILIGGISGLTASLCPKKLNK